MRYAVIIEPAGMGFSAFVPDLPGCVAAGGSVPEVATLIREAVEFHVEGLREDGAVVPPPSVTIEYVEIPG